MDLANMLIKNMTSKSSLGALAGKSGGSADQIEKAITSAIPSLLGSMTKNASSAEGAKSLVGALSQHKDTSEISSQLKNADETDGNKIIGKIMGGGKDDFITQIAKASGLNIGQTNSVLSSIAPALLSTISAAAKPDKPEDIEKEAKAREKAAKEGGKNDSFLSGFFKNFMKDEDDKDDKEGLGGAALLDILKKTML